MNTISRLVTNPLIVGLIVMLCMGLLAHRVFGLMDADVFEPIVVSDENKPEAQKNNQSHLDVSQLTALNLFGKAEEKAPSAEALAQKDIPETRLKLVLKGAFTSTKEDVSSALIAADSRSKAQRYFVGDEVPGNALLHEVSAHAVVLKRGGKLEKLLFPRAVGQSQVSTAPKEPSNVRKEQGSPVIGNNPNSLRQRLEHLRKQREQLDQNENNIRI